MSKRKLTPKEIKSILTVIKTPKKIPKDSASAIVKTYRDDLKKQLEDEMIYPDMIPKLREMIGREYAISLISPGASVGVIAAQSIGEKQTQSSVIYNEEILLRKNGEITLVKIGEYIDSEFNIKNIKNFREFRNIILVGHRSLIKKMDDLEVLTVSQDEEIMWQKVSEISRHPVGGDLVKVTTQTGKVVTTTLSHSHLGKRGNRIVPVLGSDLKVGDCVPVMIDAPVEEEEYRKKLGIDGEIKKNNIGDVFWDPIKSLEIIKEKDYDYKYVYDFSVPGNETFALASGIVVHNTLNSFHKAGSVEKAVTVGVPRVEELLNTTKSPKCINCFIYVTRDVKINETIADIRKTIGHTLIEMNLGKLAHEFKVIMDKEEERWYKYFRVRSKRLEINNFDDYDHCVRVVMNMDLMYENRITLKKIADLINKNYSDLACVYSGDKLGYLDIFVCTDDIKLPEQRVAYIDEDNACQIYLEEVVIPNLKEIYVQGVKNIKNIFFNRDDEMGGWMIETDGGDLKSLLGHVSVDKERTISNHMWDIYDTLGIEATRQFLINEFMEIMDGVNSCHVKLLADKMTHSGTLTSVTRYSMRKGESGPLVKSSFEEPMDNLLKGAAYGQVDDTCGVSASIICGKVAQMGSGKCDIMLDIGAYCK